MDPVGRNRTGPRGLDPGASSSTSDRTAVCVSPGRRPFGTDFETLPVVMSEKSTGPRILVIDDDPLVGSLFTRILGNDGYIVEVATNGLAGQAAINANPPDLVLLDVMMPGPDGFAVCRRLKRDGATRLTPVIMVTGMGDRQKRVEGLEAGADDFLTKPVDREELLVRVRSLVRMKRFTDDLDSAGSVIMRLAVMIEARIGYTDGHCDRMASYAIALGRRLGLGDQDLQALSRAGVLHDIGMLAVPDSVLHKAGTLSPEERQLVRTHATVGDSLCQDLRSLRAVRPIVRHHHEHLDGSGYPDGLRGDQIPLLAQIVGLVDVYDALTTPRPYREAVATDQAIDTLRAQACAGWRRHDLVDALADAVGSGTRDAVDSSTAALPAAAL